MQARIVFIKKLEDIKAIEDILYPNENFKSNWTMEMDGLAGNYAVVTPHPSIRFPYQFNVPAPFPHFFILRREWLIFPEDTLKILEGVF